MFHLWHQNHDGMSGHVFVLEHQMRELREEMVAQRMVCGPEGGHGIPLYKLETPQNWYVSAIEVDEALEAASSEPTTMTDATLWTDFLEFLRGAAERGGMRVR